MDEFVLPSFESTCIFKDKDIVRVTKKGGKQKQVFETHGTYHTKDSEIVDKQPILPAIKDSQDDSDGCKSKNKEDRCAREENAIHKQTPLNEDTNSKKKRKQSDKPQSSKMKKIKLISPEMPIATTAQDEHGGSEQNQSCSHKKDHQKHLDRTAKSFNGDDRSDSLVVPENDASVRRRTSSVATEDSLDPVDGFHKRKACTRKTPSRTARRKKVKRQLRQIMRGMAIHHKEKDVQSQVPANDIDGVSAKHQAVNQIREAEEEIVPVVVRPGHIRFEPLDAERSKLQSSGPVETLQWNGTTSKKKGQKWGRENTSSKRNDDNVCNGASNEKFLAEEGKHVHGRIDFESLYPLIRLPEEGDVLVYRLVELSSSWCPELSPFRVGKVSSYDSISLKIVLVPVPEYPLFSEEKNSTEELVREPDNTHYKEDGSLEIEYASLVDVRLLKPNESEAVNVNAIQVERTIVAAPVNNWEASLAKNTTESVTPSIERRPNMGWEQIEQALTDKKAELQQDNDWGSWTPNRSTSTTSWSYGALRGSALGPTLALLRGKEAKYASTVHGRRASSGNGRYANSNGKYSGSTSGRHNGSTKKW